MSQQYINVLLSEGNSLQVLADVDTVVDCTAIHVADLLYEAILEKLKKSEDLRLQDGRYSVRLMATVVEAPDE